MRLGRVIAALLVASLTASARRARLVAFDPFLPVVKGVNGYTQYTEVLLSQEMYAVAILQQS